MQYKCFAEVFEQRMSEMGAVGTIRKRKLLKMRLLKTSHECLDARMNELYTTRSKLLKYLT